MPADLPTQAVVCWHWKWKVGRADYCACLLNKLTERLQRFESSTFRSLVSMNASLHSNRRRVSGLSEDGKADGVVDKKGMGKSEMSPKEYLSRWISTKSCGR